MIVQGVYLGKNIYIHNPSCEDRYFSTDLVYVNGLLKLNNPTTSAYEIDLSDFPINARIEIKIVFYNECQPTVINPQVIRPKDSFSFITLSVNQDSINWSTLGETGINNFIIEYRVVDRWLIWKVVKGKGIPKGSYSAALAHNYGDNQYRIRYIDQNGKITYSSVVTYRSELEPVTFHPANATTKITLSRTAPFEVLDPTGNLVLKGKDHEINIKNLDPGLYYLVIENRTEKFTKK